MYGYAKAVGMAAQGIIRLAAQKLQAWLHRGCTYGCTRVTRMGAMGL